MTSLICSDPSLPQQKQRFKIPISKHNVRLKGSGNKLAIYFSQVEQVCLGGFLQDFVLVLVVKQKGLNPNSMKIKRDFLKA